MTSRTGVSGPLPWPTPRMAMSRSVIMPTSLSFSPTGIAPASISAMTFATSRMLCPGVATRTSRVIASLTLMGSPFVRVLLRRPEQKIDRADDGRNRHCNAAAHRRRRGGDDERGLLRRERFRGCDAEEKRERDQDPAAQVGHQDPPHRAVIGKRPLARRPRSARRILEERERIEVE